MGGVLDPKRVEELLERWNSDLPSSFKDLVVKMNGHPVIAIFIIVFIIISAVPFLLFVGFALGTLMFMLISFVLVEGTLLAFGACILASALFFATVAAFGVSFTLGSLWFVLTNWRQLMKDCEHFLDEHLNQVRGHFSLPREKNTVITATT